MKKLVHLVMAARPNMMKIAPLYHALAAEDGFAPELVHTGQHYDDNMSGAFLRDFDLPAPHHHLGIGSGSHAEQTGRTMMEYEALCLRARPDLTVVVGDVNATVACALSAKKLGIAVAHMEAGLRSFDRSMPEEINRLATDAISDWLWTPSRDATAQLLKEGAAEEKIVQVGNIMIDSYCMVERKIAADDTRASIGLTAHDYALVTFHRPANVDDERNLRRVVAVIEDIASQVPVVFPMHPRTRGRLDAAGLTARLSGVAGVHICAPLPYIRFMNLVRDARLVVTDSGGVQEETSYLGVACLTLRSTTERPVTVSEGTNRLAGFDTVSALAREALSSPLPARPVIASWDGKAAARTVEHIKKILL